MEIADADFSPCASVPRELMLALCFRRGQQLLLGRINEVRSYVRRSNVHCT